MNGIEEDTIRYIIKLLPNGLTQRDVPEWSEANCFEPFHVYEALAHKERRRAEATRVDLAEFHVSQKGD